MKITLKQKSDVSLLVASGKDEYILNASSPSVDIHPDASGLITFEELDKKEKLTFKRAVLFILTQILIIISRVFFLAKPDWLDYIEPFTITGTLQLSSDCDEMTLSYRPGGYDRKKSALYPPTLKCDNDNAVVRTELHPDYKGLKDVYTGFMVNTVIFFVLALLLLSLLLYFSAPTMDPGVIVLISFLLGVIALVLAATLIYNRFKYNEIKKLLDNHEAVRKG